MKSPYREQLNVIVFCFGRGKQSAAIVGAMRANKVQQMYVCLRMVQELKKLECELLSAGQSSAPCQDDEHGFYFTGADV